MQLAPFTSYLHKIV